MEARSINYWRSRKKRAREGGQDLGKKRAHKGREERAGLVIQQAELGKVVGHLVRGVVSHSSLGEAAQELPTGRHCAVEVEAVQHDHFLRDDLSSGQSSSAAEFSPEQAREGGHHH